VLVVHLRALTADRHAYTTTVLDFLARTLGKDPVAATRRGARTGAGQP
jgi:hypothetical protein